MGRSIDRRRQQQQVLLDRGGQRRARVADLLDIPFYLINVEQPFKARVVDFTVDRYLAGETPNPCIQCNRHIRFDYLYNYAMGLGADYLATGHYARVRQKVSGVT